MYVVQEIRHIIVNDTSIQFVDELKYLGWFIVSRRIDTSS